VVLAALALTAAACGERPEPVGRSAHAYPVAVEGATGRETVLVDRPERVVALGRRMHELLARLGVRARLASSADAVQTADLVAAWESDSLGAARVRGQAPVYIAPDESIRDVERALIDLGLLVNRPLRARRLVQRIEARRRTITAAVRNQPVATAFVDLGFFTTIAGRSLAGDLIRQARGHSVAGPAPDPGPFEVVQLVRVDPDVYIATDNSGTTLTSLRNDPRLRGLRAVRAGRFGTIPLRFLQPGPHVDEGLERIARLLHPNAFR
jgi:iron complex transport system substrate-binding protein